jgi:hypothetical protein
MSENILGDEATLEEWLDGYLGWDNGESGNKNELRMSRKSYFKRYFPKDYDYIPQWEQLQRIKTELRKKDILHNYCEDHKWYNSKYGINCPKCKTLKMTKSIIIKE